MSNKFYYDTEGNDDAAYSFAMQYASKIANNDLDIERIVLLSHTNHNTGWFDRLFGREIVKQLLRGIKFEDCRVIYQFVSKARYKNQSFKNQDIVICCALDSKDILKLDEMESTRYIIAIPWLKADILKWVKTWNAIEISGKSDGIMIFEPSEIVKIAMKDLTESINMSTGIGHPSDNDRAKTYIRTLYKYENELNADTVGAYLVRELNWRPSNSKEIEYLINKLNEGSYFKGGDKTGLKYHYKRWQKKVKNR